jgi:hypothetical protein
MTGTGPVAGMVPGGMSFKSVDRGRHKWTAADGWHANAPVKDLETLKMRIDDIHGWIIMIV